ncbi:MAG: M55 family metallopeptidase [Cyanobacteriota bacterium]
MKIYISFDFEGINGVSKFSQVENKNKQEIEKSLYQAYKEIQAVINGALKSGVEYITINDAHSAMTNLDLNHLDDRISLITGKPKPISMMAGLDQSYNAAILLGYHARAGAPGACLAHTLIDEILNVKINGIAVGEAYLNSLYAASLNVPIAMASGDEALKEEIYQQIGEIPTVCIKKALGYNSVECRPNSIILNDLEETTFKTLTNPSSWIINKVPSPYDMEVELSQIIMADLVELIPGVNRTSSRKINYTHIDFSTIYKLLQTICIIVGSAKNYY